MTSKKIRNIEPLGFPWVTQDPFLFCAYHLDFYPAGNNKLEPLASLEGRQLGQDFVIKDGWRMYHGESIPGFPAHPHRGFETVTIVPQGLVDHSDSHGASGRYGNGDVQWMTAGSGIQHSEMFPMLNQEKKNTLEIFQIWLNLPTDKKMVDPNYKMIWKNEIPVHQFTDQNGQMIEVHQYAGEFNNMVAPLPTADSWAANPLHEVAIWRIVLQANAVWELPESKIGVNRNLYYFKGNTIQIDGVELACDSMIEMDATEKVKIENGNEKSSILMLQGKPISEPVVQYGPFVMNNRDEIQQAYQDYQKTQFGGWNWKRVDPVHGNEYKRFSKTADGIRDEPK